MKRMTLTNARMRMPELVDPIEKTVLTRDGKDVAVVLGIDAYRSLNAIVELAQDPQRFVQVMNAHNRVQMGNLETTHDLSELENALDQDGDSESNEFRQL